MNRDEFLDQLRQGRLVTADQLKEIGGRFSADAAPAAAADALVADGLLTPFQARAVLAGETQRLLMGQYRLLDELGRGGMGQVFKAFHTVMGRTVAVKILGPELQRDPVALTWFEREVRMLTQLQHSNIVLAYDANAVNGVHFLVMEYVEGQNLHRLVAREGPLPWPRACEMLFQAALALQYAHEKGVVHRDIKPGNLLVPALTPADTPTRFLAAPTAEPDGLRPRPPLIKVVDFGLASLRSSALADTIVLKSPNHFAGTPDFVSPEQCRDIHAADVRSDLYSLGCTFYFALTGQVPFGGASVMEKLANHLMEPPPRVDRLRPVIPLEVADIILRLMAKSPDERFQTPMALAQALQPWCAPSGVGIMAESRRPEAAPPPLSVIARAAELSPAAPVGPEATRVLQPTPGVLTAEAPDAPRPAADSSAGLAATPPAPPASAGGRPGREDTAFSTEMGMQAAVDQMLQNGGPLDLGDSPAGRAPTAARGAAGPTAPRSAGLPDRVLRDSWRRWTDVVALVHEQHGRGSWDNARYQPLYERLLAACRQEAGRSVGDRQGFFLQLEQLVKPWINVESLDRTEPEVLGSLLARCRQVEGFIGVRRRLDAMSRWLRLAAAPVLIFFVLVLGARAAGTLWTAAGGSAGRLDWHTLLGYFQTASLPDLAVIVLPALLLTTLALLLSWR